MRRNPRIPIQSTNQRSSSRQPLFSPSHPPRPSTLDQRTRADSASNSQGTRKRKSRVEGAPRSGAQGRGRAKAAKSEPVRPSRPDREPISSSSLNRADHVSSIEQQQQRSAVSSVKGARRVSREGKGRWTDQVGMGFSSTGRITGKMPFSDSVRVGGYPRGHGTARHGVDAVMVFGSVGRYAGHAA